MTDAITTWGHLSGGRALFLGIGALFVVWMVCNALAVCIRGWEPKHSECTRKDDANAE